LKGIGRIDNGRGLWEPEIVEGHYKPDDDYEVRILNPMNYEGANNSEKKTKLINTRCM
jgi:hypothetical protein